MRLSRIAPVVLVVPLLTTEDLDLTTGHMVRVVRMDLGRTPGHMVRVVRMVALLSHKGDLDRTANQISATRANQISTTRTDSAGHHTGDLGYTNVRATSLLEMSALGR
jgi:hypothetical protein